jgi:hypothetical protein
MRIKPYSNIKGGSPARHLARRYNVMDGMNQVLFRESRSRVVVGVWVCDNVVSCQLGGFDEAALSLPKCMTRKKVKVKAKALVCLRSAMREFTNTGAHSHSYSMRYPYQNNICIYIYIIFSLIHQLFSMMPLPASAAPAILKI